MQVKIRHKPIFVLIFILEINYKKNPGQNQLPGFTMDNLQTQQCRQPMYLYLIRSAALFAPFRADAGAA